MKNTTIDQIKHIVDNLDFEGPDRLRVKDGKMLYQFTPAEDGNHSELEKGLSNVIYSEFYCAAESEASSEPTFEERLKFVAKLRAANASEDKLHHGWKVNEVSSQGLIYASKGNYQQQVNPGDYVRGSMSEAVAKGSEISIYQHKEYDNNEEVFFYIFGETLTEAAAPSLVRFYFNAKPEGAIALVKHLSTYFNKYRIPFQFKCLNQPAFYNRTDSAVLYLSKNYTDFAWEIMQKFYPAIKGLLNPALPYFVKRLAPGIGFAENPMKEKESFGQNRASVIAQGLVKAFDKKLAKSEYLDVVLDNVDKSGFAVDAFYLNPGQRYGYDLKSLS